MKSFDEITNIINSLLNEEEREELLQALNAAKFDEDYHVIKYAEKLDLRPSVLYNWGSWKRERAAV